MKVRTPEEIVRDVAAHQEAGIFHPLTCGNDSTHGLLQAEIRDGVAVLTCPDCDYVQERIPDLPTEDETADMQDAYNQLFKAMSEG